MTDWIEHNGGTQPVDDETWVEFEHRVAGHFLDLAQRVDWIEAQGYRILNQHLIDAKQAEINALRDDLETWQSVFPHVMPDRLKSDQQLADEDVAAKIAAARLEGIRLGMKAAEEAAHEYAYQCRAGGHFEMAIAFATHADDLRNLNPDTIAREAALDQLTREAQADNMGYDND